MTQKTDEKNYKKMVEGNEKGNNEDETKALY
jgi:hypothetical protein